MEVSECVVVVGAAEWTRLWWVAETCGGAPSVKESAENGDGEIRLEIVGDEVEVAENVWDVSW